MSRFVTTLLIGTALLGSATAAKATTLDETFSFYSQANGTYSQTGPAAQYTGQSTSTFAAPTFDTTRGTLNSITITFSAALSATAKAQGGQAGDTVSALIVDFPFTLSSSATGTPVTLESFTQYADNPPGNGNASLGGSGTGFSGTITGTGTQSFGTNTNSFSQAASVAQAFFSSYESNGSGSINLSVKSGAINVANGSSNDQNVFFGGSVAQTGTVTIDYNYSTPAPVGVPEPASMAILGAGLIGAGLVRRRRASK